jgi:predicted transcriptional regulator of viral defense system
MIRYMYERHGIKASAVRTCVSQLLQRGTVERIARGRYKRSEGAASSGAANNATGLGTP